MAVNYKQLYAKKKKYEQTILKACPNIKDESGIYFLTRTDENGISYFYIGQSVTVKSRMISHAMGYQQHIDLSIHSRGFYSDQNPFGWKLNVIYYPKDKLDEMEQYWILEYTKKGYQCRYNKTSGSQGVGKEKINEYRPAKGYREGVLAGYKKASKEISHLFELHLSFSTKSENPSVNQKKAFEKFKDFLEFYKQKDGEE